MIKTEEVQSYYDKMLPKFIADLDGSQRLSFIKNTLQALVKPNFEVLDLCCGIGITTDFINALGGNPLGVDFAPGLIKFASENHGGAYLCADVTELNLNKRFDLINLNDGMEHIETAKLNSLFEVLSRHSHKDTIILLNIPHPEYIKYVKKHRPDLCQIIENPISHPTIVDLCEKHDFMIVDMKSYQVEFNWQYVQYVIQKYPPVDKQDYMWGRLLNKQPKLSDRPKELTKPDVVTSGRLKVSVIANLDSFMHILTEDWVKHYDLKRFRGKTVQDLNALSSWSDVCWFEWCDEPLAVATSQPKLSKIINRLHRYEAYGPMPLKVDWDKVDDLIFVAEHVRNRVVNMLGDKLRSVRTHVIPNPIDTNRFDIPQDKEANKKVAWVGLMRKVKNPEHFILHADYILSRDDSYRFFIAGKFADIELEEYIKYLITKLNLGKYITFDYWQGDMAAWLRDKTTIVNTSMIEGQPVSIAEAAASGVRPLIAGFPNAESIFPESYLFLNSDDLYNRLKEKPEPGLYRDWAVSNFDKNIILPKLRNIIEE